MVKSKFVRIAVSALVMASATAALANDDAAAKPDKKAASDLVCKKFPVTGSLISSRRICKTPAEWRNDEERIRQMNESNNCTSNFSSGCSG